MRGNSLVEMLYIRIAYKDCKEAAKWLQKCTQPELQELIAWIYPALESGSNPPPRTIMITPTIRSAVISLLEQAQQELDSGSFYNLSGYMNAFVLE